MPAPTSATVLPLARRGAATAVALVTCLADPAAVRWIAPPRPATAARATRAAEHRTAA